MTGFTYHPDPRANQLATSLIHTLIKERDILGLFLSGSTARGGRDRYSDVDISLVVQHKERFKKQLPHLMQTVSPLLFGFEPHFLLPDFYIFYLKAGYKFDFYIYGPEDSLGWSFSQQAVVVLDTDNRLAAAQAEWTKKPPPEGLDEKYLMMALADLWALRREIHRRDLFEARDNLDDARRCIATYINLTHDHAYFGYDQFDTYLDAALISEMKRSLQDNDSFQGMIQAGLSLLKVIASLHVFDREIIDLTHRELYRVLSTLNSRPNPKPHLWQEVR